MLPEIDRTGVERLTTLAERESAAAIPPAAIRRLAALLPRNPSIAEDVGARLKLSKADRRRLINAAEPTGGDLAQVMSYRLGTTLAIDRILLSNRPVTELAGLSDWVAPTLPLTGGALVGRGVNKGPDVARLLRTIEEQWIAEGFPDAARVSVIADATVVQWGLAAR